MSKLLDAPIPGESLTTNPKGFPWERPPEISDPEEAIETHLEKLSDPDNVEPLLMALEGGMMTLEGVTRVVVRNAVANGIHSIDVGLVIAPVIHEFIKKTADKVGVEYKETTGKSKISEKDREDMASFLSKTVEVSPEEEEVEPSEEEVLETLTIEEVEELPIKESKGLMSRGRE